MKSHAILTKNKEVPSQEHRAITGPKSPIKAEIKSRLAKRIQVGKK